MKTPLIPFTVNELHLLRFILDRAIDAADVAGCNDMPLEWRPSLDAETVRKIETSFLGEFDTLTADYQVMFYFKGILSRAIQVAEREVEQ